MALDLKKYQVSNLYMARQHLKSSLELLSTVFVEKNDMTLRKIQAALDEVDYELDSYNLVDH